MAGNADARLYPSEAKPGDCRADWDRASIVSWPLAAWKRLLAPMLAQAKEAFSSTGNISGWWYRWRGQDDGSLLSLVGYISAG